MTAGKSKRCEHLGLLRHNHALDVGVLGLNSVRWGQANWTHGSQIIIRISLLGFCKTTSSRFRGHWSPLGLAPAVLVPDGVAIEVAISHGRSAGTCQSRLHLRVVHIEFLSMASELLISSSDQRSRLS